MAFEVGLAVEQPSDRLILGSIWSVECDVEGQLMKRPKQIIQINDYSPTAERIDDDILWKAYEGDNYKIVLTPKHPEGEQTAVVYFSSNALWFSGKHSFYDRILKRDYYEWQKNRLEGADAHIWLRDLFCCFYYYGINTQIDSIEKIRDFLSQLLKGYRKVIFVGASAGGYAAALLGNMLNVSYVLSFSGQFDADAYLAVCRPNQPEIPKMLSGKDAEERQVFRQIASFVRQGQVPVYYFVGSENLQDKNDCEIALSLPNVRVFQIKNDKHGMVFDKHCLKRLINMSQSELEQLYQKCAGRIIGTQRFGFWVKGWAYLPWCLYHYTKKCERYLRSWRKKFMLMQTQR